MDKHRPRFSERTRLLVQGQRGLQERIAEIGEFSPAYVSKVISGKSPAGRQFLRALAEALVEHFGKQYFTETLAVFDDSNEIVDLI